MQAGGLDEQALELFEQSLHDFIVHHVAQPPLAQQVSYHFGLEEQPNLRRGKRLRPRLLMSTAASFGCPSNVTHHPAIAIELLHNYSLIHDDIEDGDRLRHGHPSLWVTFGQAHGINAGDAVGAMAALALAGASQSLDAQALFAMSVDLAQANLLMCEGQSRDLALEAGTAVSIDEYLRMIERKTASLFECAAGLGARCARASDADIARCRDIGRQFGLGFQIRNDEHGIWGVPDETGKSAAGDLVRRKKTFPVVWAMEHDPDGCGAAIAEAFAVALPMDESAVNRLRGQLESCGAVEAVRVAADNYFKSAHALASGLQPLSDFIVHYRTT